MTHIQNKEVCLCRTGKAKSAQISSSCMSCIFLICVYIFRSILVWDSSLHWERCDFYKTTGRQTVNRKVVITLSRKKKKKFYHAAWVCTSLEEESEQTSDEMAALLFTSCPCLWVTDPCRREQHRNREHYSEIKVDLELLPHHLAHAAGKSKRCRKWMNTQRG